MKINGIIATIIYRITTTVFKCKENENETKTTGD